MSLPGCAIHPTTGSEVYFLCKKDEKPGHSSIKCNNPKKEFIHFNLKF